MYKRQLLCFCIGTEVFQDEVWIRSVVTAIDEQRIVQLAESLRLVRRILPVDQLHQHVTDILIGIEQLGRIITALFLKSDDLIGAHTEEMCIRDSLIISALHACCCGIVFTVVH